MRTRMKLAIAAILALTLGLAALAAFYILAEPPLSESELDAIVRAWAEDNMDGAAGDEPVEFVVANTTVNSTGSLRLFLKARMDSGATWSYGPFAGAGGGSYEASATVALRLNDIMPTLFPDEMEAAGKSAPTSQVDPGDFRNVFTLTFLLTVDPASKSATEWRVRDGEAVYVHIPPAAQGARFRPLDARPRTRNRSAKPGSAARGLACP